MRDARIKRAAAAARLGDRRLRANCELLEARVLLSGSNAIDQLTFGDVSSDAFSETTHSFEPGYTPSQMPLTGTGALGQTYREPFGLGDSNTDGPQQLLFTMTVDPTRQNYLTIKLWGSDVDGGAIYLAGNPVGQDTPITIQNYPNGSLIDNQGGPPAFPGRFFYYTVPIPEASTLGKTSAQLTLNFISFYDYYGGTGFNYLSNGQLTRPVYAVYTTTDPEFTPDPNAPTGSAPSQTTTSLNTLTAAQAQSLITTVLNNIYVKSGNEYSTVTARQIPAGTSGAPPEVIGLDLFTNLSTWLQSSHTPDQWRDQIADQLAGRGYTGFPDELLSVLGTSYLTPLLSYSPTQEASAYHSSTVLANIVAAMDGASYSQGSDGGFPTQGGNWIGLVTSPRTEGTYIGLTGRQPTIHGGGSLQGIDTATLGETIINLLNDPVGGPAFQTYLSQTYDADLDGSHMLRAYAYERMLFNHIIYLQQNSGGTVSQDLFEALALYASQVALEKLQALYPNPAYPALPATIGLYYAQQALGLAPTTLLGHNEGADYAMSAAGLGEADGTYSGGYDGGYGTYFPELTPYFADLASEDPGATSASQQTAVAQIIAQSANTFNSFDEFISPGSNVTFNANGTIATDQQILSQEGFITYRNSENPNFESFNVDSSYLASDPAGPIKDADALRSAYLETQYGVTPDVGYSNNTLASLQDIRQLGAYERTINSLVNVAPTSIAPLPGEPGQPNFAFADVQTGAVAFIENGERFYMNANYRSTEDQVDYYARIHYTTPTIDRAALIMAPYDSTTVQPDGNLTGNYNSPWVVRYGNYLIVLNHSSLSDTVSLPAGIGSATDLLTGDTFAMGSSVVVAAGKAAILDLSSPVSTNLAGTSSPAPQGSGPAAQTPASIVAGYSAINMVNDQQEQFIAEVLNSSNQPINIVPQITWSLQSGSVGSIVPDGTYTAPSSGLGTATVIATYGAVSASFVVTIVPLTAPGHDVGTVGLSGTDSFSSGTYSLTGAGAGMSGTADSFHSLSAQISGDVSVIAKVTSQTGTGASAGAGVMIRDTGSLATTAANSSFADMIYLPQSNTLEFQWRAADGGSVLSTSVASPSSTPFVEITRTAGSFSAFYGTNGTTWTQLGTAETLTMATLAQAGLAATSGSTSQSSTTTFQNVQIARVSSEFPTYTVNPAAAWRGGTSNVIDTTSTVTDGSAHLALTYLWWPVAWPADGAVTVGGHGTTSSGVSFEVIKAGTYTFAEQVTDAYGLVLIGTATATVSQTFTSLVVSSPKQYVTASGTQQMSVQALDEFGLPMTAPAITWSVTGGGSISSSGLFTAPSTSDVSTITGKNGSISDTAIIGTAAFTNAGTDIGTVGIAGSENYVNGGTYTITGSGAGITGTADAFHFVSTPLSGSFSVSGELLSQSATNAAAGAGLMIRGSTSPGAIVGAIIDSPINGDGLLFEWRSVAGGPVSWAAAPVPLGPTWLNLVDNGGTVTASYSVDGLNWTQIGSAQSLSLGTTPQVGLAVTSADNTTASTAVFNNLSLSTSGPTIAVPAAAATSIVTTPSAALSVLGADPAGESTLKYTWSAIGNLTAGVTFSANGTNASKNTTVNFPAPGVYDLHVVVTDNSGLTATSDVVLNVIQQLAAAGTNLGIFTTAQDVGAPAIAGSSAYNATTGVYTIAGSGSDIWSTSDQFQFAYEQLTGDGVITARVVSTQNTQSGGHSKAGIMFRNSLAANSAFADAVLTYSDGVEFDYRASTGTGPSQVGTITSGVPAGGPYWLRLIRVGNTFEVDAAPDVSGSPGTFTEIASKTVSITMNPTVYVGLAVSAVNTAALNTATFDNVSISAPSGSFPASQDIGSPAVAGSYTQSAGTATMTASGLDIFGNSDQFQFAYMPITGNATITARVVSLTNTNTNAKAGVMIRNSLTANSAEVSTLVTASNGINLDYRIAAGGSTGETKITGLAAPYWVRVQRTLISGNSYSFASFRSPDGVTWTQIGSAQTITMDPTVLVGLAVTSHSATTLTTAKFDNITVTGTADVAPTVAVPAAAGNITGNSANLSVTGADSDGGGESNLIYTWTAVGAPASGTGSVAFSATGTNAAKNATATFNQAGSYLLKVTITDQGNLSVSSFVPVTITQNVTSISVSPAAATVSPLGTGTFSAIALDQFGVPLAQPGFTWSVIGGTGSINPATGVYSATLTGTFATVQAASGSITGSASVTILNQHPLFATSSLPSASPNIVTGLTTMLSALGVDDSGESNLTYTWAAINSPPAPVGFSPNINAKNPTATFTEAGTYTLQVTIQDPWGQSISQTVTVVVNPVFTSIAVSPTTPNISDGQMQSFTATALDQFGVALSPQPPSFFWTIDNGGVGSIDSSGNFTAPGSGPGSATVRATSGSISGTATVTIILSNITGPTGHDQIRLVRDGAALDVFIDNTTSAPTYSVPFASLGALAVTGGIGDDITTIDFSGGASPVPSAGLTVNGGAGKNSLIITGTSVGDTAVADASSLAFNGSVIDYLNEESLSVDSGTGTDVLTQAAQPSAALAFDPASSSATLNVNAGIFTFPASTNGIIPQTFGTLSIAAGATVSLASDFANPANKTVLILGNLSIAQSGGAWTGTLDLGANDLILQAGGASGLTQAFAQLASGFNAAHGYWNGSGGIASSAAAGDTTFLTTLGVMENTTGAPFDSQPSNIGDILIKHTYYGDADLDGTLTGADYQQIDQGFGLNKTGWSNGDFNYDGIVDGSDYALLDNAFNQVVATNAGPLALATRAVAMSTDNLTKASFAPSPSPGTPGEGWGEGSSSVIDDLLDSAGTYQSSQKSRRMPEWIE